ncbi:MAG: hypothetical protein K2X87_28700 [Gemmataceae bacterium]|nr:hypothetical protein [Gemmataceae bacterium]
MAVTPFHLRYSLTRGQRSAVELAPWLPCLAAALGFAAGAAFLARVVSPWFLLLLPLPAALFPGFVGFLYDLAAHPLRPVDVVVEAERLGVLVGGGRVWLPLAGVIQVYRSNHDTWTLLHLNGSVLTIPAGAITREQVEFLQGFALRAARERWAAAD